MIPSISLRHGVDLHRLHSTYLEISPRKHTSSCIDPSSLEPFGMLALIAEAFEHRNARGRSTLSMLKLEACFASMGPPGILQPRPGGVANRRPVRDMWPHASSRTRERTGKEKLPCSARKVSRYGEVFRAQVLF